MVLYLVYLPRSTSGGSTYHEIGVRSRVSIVSARYGYLTNVRKEVSLGSVCMTLQARSIDILVIRVHVYIHDYVSAIRIK